MRNQLLHDMEEVKAGRDPICTIRDPEKNVCIALPGDRVGFGGSPLSKQEWLERHRQSDPTRQEGDYFPHLSGQPEHIRQEFVEAMGVE
jgi:hypothetical protein